MPAFGQADLSNCEREQIHLAGSIQPHGALLLVRDIDGVILQASTNASEFLGAKSSLLGCNIAILGSDLVQHFDMLRSSPPQFSPLDSTPIAIRCQIGDPAFEFDVLVHRPPEGGWIMEFEPASTADDLTDAVEKALQAIVAVPSLQGLCEETASIFKHLSGYDRVMVYRFDEEGHGEVFSERKEPELEAYLGNRYPASDIPQIARRLYERTRLRMLVDVNYDPVPLVPRLCPITERDLDMSLCFLRSMSPIHIQYLKNMGVRATMVASLVVGGRLWGLIACHHYTPRNIPFETRAACELLAETIATRVAALESFAQAQAELSVRRLERRMIEAISQDGDWRTALFDNSQSLLQPVRANGAALLFEGRVLSTGAVPGTQQLWELAEWLDDQPRQYVMSTASLGFDDQKFLPLLSVASGLVATPISNSSGEYLMWFRPERIRMVTWGGDPLEPVLIGDDPSSLSPRRSFAKWHQLVEGKCEPWTPADLVAARLIAETVTDVILQFRSVRLLIARDQLEQVTQQVQISELPVVVADPEGRILMNNKAFERLMPSTLSREQTQLQQIEDLAPLFSNSQEALKRLRDLINYRRTWRGEMAMPSESGKTRSVLIRGDPVFASPSRVLGFVILFTDNADRSAAEEASKRFHERLIDRPRMTGVRRGTRPDLLYEKLLSSVLENAQLAALEITDGTDRNRMMQMLESVRASTSRAAEVLDHLIRHTMRQSGDNE